MIKPKNIRIVNDKGFFRLKYEVGVRGVHKLVTTEGFKNRKELAKIIKNDVFFELDIEVD